MHSTLAHTLEKNRERQQLIRRTLLYKSMMIVLILMISFLQMICSTSQELSNIRYSSLISAQCKARCLFEYRNHSHHRSWTSNHGLTLPWRSIWERCPRLFVCNSCLLPCDLDPALLLSNKQTCQAICSSLKVWECEQSCLFIQNLYEQEFDCLAGYCRLCSLTNDCPENIPQLSNVVAIERKSRRTVRLKWNSNQLNNTEPVFYVIEAQWNLPKTDQNPYELVSKWGFVKEEVSNTKAIIRNIQRDNRWYQFRVAAVTRHGYSPFSITSKPFRLTNQSHISSSIIDPPKNFSIKDYQSNSNTINLTLSWEPSSVSGYQISWEFDNNRSSVDTSSSELMIPFLSLDKTYLFQIRSLILSHDKSILMSSPENLHFNYREQFSPLKNVRISHPYFINGLIKANISWTEIPDDRIKQYDIYWIETQCHSSSYRRDAVTIQNSFQLYDLRFNCTYLVNINIIGFEQIQSFPFYFNVSSCQLTEVIGTIQPPCQTDGKTIDIFSSLPTLDLMVTSNGSGLNLFWQNIHSTVENVFYRLQIDQLPDHRNLLSIHLPLFTTNYFLPYSTIEDDRYLNVTLSLIDHLIIRQEQSILIHDKYNDAQLNKAMIILPRRSLLLVLMCSISSSIMRNRFRNF